MGHVFHQLFYHFVWATHAREPHIHPSYRSDLLRIVHEEHHHRAGRLSELLEATEGDEDDAWPPSPTP